MQINLVITLSQDFLFGTFSYMPEHKRAAPLLHGPTSVGSHHCDVPEGHLPGGQNYTGFLDIFALGYLNTLVLFQLSDVDTKSSP